MSTRQSPVERVLDVASKFEDSHYEDKHSTGGAEPLKKSDFEAASQKVSDGFTNAVTAAKEAVVGKDENDKSVASSPAEISRSAFSQLLGAGLTVKGLVAPRAYALERSPDDKWADAKEEARESGRQASASAKDALGAIGDRVDRWGNKVSHEADKAGDKAERWTEDRKDDVKRAGDRTKDAFYNVDATARGVANEVNDLGRRAADRVQGDWQEVKEATKDVANNSSTARLHREAREAEEKAKAEGGGFFGWVKSLAGDGGNKADDAVRRAESSARSAADDVRDSANSAYRTAQDKAQQGKNEARGWFGAASDEVHDATTNARRTGNRVAGSMNERTESGKEIARGWMSSGQSSADDVARHGRHAADRASDRGRNYVDAAGDKLSELKDRAGNKINRFGNRVSNAADEAEHWTKDTIHEVGDYLTADLGAHSSSEAAVQRGYIPSNTADVISMLSRRYR